MCQPAKDIGNDIHDLGQSVSPLVPDEIGDPGSTGDALRKGALIVGSLLAGSALAAGASATGAEGAAAAGGTVGAEGAAGGGAAAAGGESAAAAASMPAAVAEGEGVTAGAAGTSGATLGGSDTLGTIKTIAPIAAAGAQVAAAGASIAQAQAAGDNKPATNAVPEKPQSPVDPDVAALRKKNALLFGGDSPLSTDLTKGSADIGNLGRATLLGGSTKLGG